MIILIDAYNVLKQGSSAKHISDAQRTAFIKRLDRYGRLKEHTIIVVFDAGESSRPTEERRGMTRIIYSGHNASADEILKRLCAQFKHLQAVVVSNDREVCSYAHMHGITCVEVEALYELLDSYEQRPEISLHKQQGQALKRAGHESSEELDALMHESSSHMLFKSEDVELRGRDRKPAPAVPSKAEKKLKKVIRKL